MSSSRSNSRTFLSDKNHWQLQAEGGRRVGPLTTAQMLERISMGNLNGDEKIRKLPDGPWIDISKEPIFYDRLLEILDKSIAKSSNKKQSALTDDDETRIGSISSTNNNDDDATQIRIPENKISSTNKSSLPQQEPSSNDVVEGLFENNALVPIQDLAPVIEEKINSENLPVVSEAEALSQSAPSTKQGALVAQMKLKPDEVPEFKKKQQPSKSPLNGIMLSFVVVFIAVGVAAYFDPKLFLTIASGLGFNTNTVAKKSGIRLLAPKAKSQKVLTAAEISKYKKETYQELNSDTVESYFKAQDNLIRVVESAPEDPEAKGLLCYVHLQLWPFVKQSSEDLEAALSVKRSANNYDDLNKTHCEVTYLMMTGRFNEAIGVIQEVGNRNDLPQSPILSSIRAEILAAKQNYKDAIPWARQAAEDWKFWVRPKFQLAYYLKENAEIDQAMTVFNEILNQNPKHKLSLIEYGSLLYGKKSNVQLAEKLLTAAEQNSAKVFRDQESKLYFNLAHLYLDQNKKEKALSFAGKSFQMNPADLKVRELVVQLGGSPNALMKGAKNYELIFLGDQFFRAGDYLAAQAEYKTAFEIDPTSAIAAEKAAKSLWLIYEKQDAIVFLGNAISADPKMGSSYYLMADYYSQLYNFQGAAEILARGAKIIPASLDIQKAFALVEYRRRNYKVAAAYLEQARKKYDSDIDIHILLAKAYLALGTDKDIEMAKSVIVRALILDDLNVEAQVVHGKIIARTSMDAAVEYFNSKIKKYSENPEFRVGLAETYKEAERIKDAQNLYEATLLLYEKNKPALMGLGDCYAEQEMWLPALKKYLAASIIDPLDAEPVFKSGMVYMQAKRYQEAKAQFQRGVEVLKVYPKGYYYLGKAAFALKDYPLALQAIAEERKNNPDLADSYILAGEIYSEMQDYVKCTSELQVAIRMRPKGAEAYVKLAQCMIWTGNLESAEAMLNIATAQESGYAEIYKVQGLVFEKQAQIPEAIQAYEKYITLAPNAPDKKIIESRIKQLDSGH